MADNQIIMIALTSVSGVCAALIAALWYSLTKAIEDCRADIKEVRGMVLYIGKELHDEITGHKSKII